MSPYVRESKVNLCSFLALLALDWEPKLSNLIKQVKISHIFWSGTTLQLVLSCDDLGSAADSKWCWSTSSSLLLVCVGFLCRSPVSSGMDSSMVTSKLSSVHTVGGAGWGSSARVKSPVKSTKYLAQKSNYTWEMVSGIVIEIRSTFFWKLWNKK